MEVGFQADKTDTGDDSVAALGRLDWTRGVKAGRNGLRESSMVSGQR